MAEGIVDSHTRLVLLEIPGDVSGSFLCQAARFIVPLMFFSSTPTKGGARGSPTTDALMRMRLGSSMWHLGKMRR